MTQPMDEAQKARIEVARAKGWTNFATLHADDTPIEIIGIDPATPGVYNVIPELDGPLMVLVDSPFKWHPTIYYTESS